MEMFSCIMHYLAVKSIRDATMSRDGVPKVLELKGPLQATRKEPACEKM